MSEGKIGFLRSSDATTTETDSGRLISLPSSPSTPSNDAPPLPPKASVTVTVKSTSTTTTTTTSGGATPPIPPKHTNGRPSLPAKHEESLLDLDFDESTDHVSTGGGGGGMSASTSSMSVSTGGAIVDAPFASVAPSLDAAPVDTTTPPNINDVESWAISRQDCVRYARMFRAIDADNDGYATGAEVRSVFLQSQLPTPELAQVWTLCEPSNGQLDIRQFALGMWLCNARRHGAVLPPQVPRRLAASVAAAGFQFSTIVEKNSRNALAQPASESDDDDDDDNASESTNSDKSSEFE